MAAPDGFHSVKGIKSTTEEPSDFKVIVCHCKVLMPLIITRRMNMSFIRQSSNICAILLSFTCLKTKKSTK